jgi:hypothetical protein
MRAAVLLLGVVLAGVLVGDGIALLACQGGVLDIPASYFVDAGDAGDAQGDR